MSSQPNALLGKGSDFQGKLTFEGTVNIEGRFTGEIFSEGTLIIGEGAEVQAEIRVGSVMVYGNVTGNITAVDAVELHAPASLRGNITSPALHIDKGVFFDGACQMTSKPMASPPPLRQSAQPVARSQVQPPPLQSAIMRESQQVHAQQAHAQQASAMPQAQQQRPSGIFLPEPTSVRNSGELPHKF